MKKLLIICGPSGSGKSYLEEQLIQNYYDFDYKFVKLPQITTRIPRNDEKDNKYYSFKNINDYIHEIINNRYFARIKIQNSDGEVHYYATKMTDDFCKLTYDKNIYTVIANLDGIKDIYKVLSYNEEFKRLVDVCVLMIDSESGTRKKRNDRSQDFVDNERYELYKENPYPVHVMKNDFERGIFITVNDVINKLYEINFIKKDNNVSNSVE